MESPAKAILILLAVSAPAAAAARHGAEKSGSIRLNIRQVAASADAAPSARRARSPKPIPDPHPDRNTIGSPSHVVRPTRPKTHKDLTTVASAPRPASARSIR